MKEGEVTERQRQWNLPWHLRSTCNTTPISKKKERESDLILDGVLAREMIKMKNEKREGDEEPPLSFFSFLLLFTLRFDRSHPLCVLLIFYCLSLFFRWLLFSVSCVYTLIPHDNCYIINSSVCLNVGR